MRTTMKVMIFSLVTAALVAPAAAAGMGGGGGGAMGGGGGAMGNGGGGGMILPQGGGGAPASGGNAPHSAPAPKSNFAEQGGLVGGRVGAGDTWRHHHPWPGGQIVNGGALYSGGDYDYDETDVNHCLVYRKAYNSAHQFIGWTHVNICAG